MRKEEQESWKHFLSPSHSPFLPGAVPAGLSQSSAAASRPVYALVVLIVSFSLLLSTFGVAVLAPSCGML